MDSTAVPPLRGRAARRGARFSRPKSALLTGAALWFPFLVAAITSHRVRHVLEDFWFWPGLFPASLWADDLYAPWFVVVALGWLVLWTVVARRRSWLGVLGALLCGFIATGRLMALLSI